MRNDFFSQKVAGSKNYLVKVTSRGLLFLSQPITEIFLRTANKRKELKTLRPPPKKKTENKRNFPFSHNSFRNTASNI